MDIEVTTFKIPGGRVANSVNDILQDGYGLLWFATVGGLRCYDGHRWRVYQHSPTDTNSISSNGVETLYFSRDSFLWVGTLGGGLNRFDYRSKTFKKFVPTAMEKLYLTGMEAINNIGDNYYSPNWVYDIEEDGEGYLWMGTGNGLFRLDRKTGQLKQFLGATEGHKGDPKFIFQRVYVDRSGTLWAGTFWPYMGEKAGGLFKYQPNEERFINYHASLSDQQALITNHIKSIFEDSRGNFWVGTMGRRGHGLHLMDRTSGTFERLFYDPDHPEKLSAPVDESKRINYDFVSAITEDKQGRIWIATDFFSGIVIYDPATQKVDRLNQGNKRLPVSGFWTLGESNDGILWAANSRGGVYQLNTVTKIEPVKYSLWEANTYFSEVIHRGHSKTTWIGAFNGLVERRPDSPIILHPKKNFFPEDSFTQFKFTSIHEDKMGNVWIGAAGASQNSDQNGLFHLSPDTNKPIRLSGPKQPDSAVTDIVSDGKSGIWVATAKNGLFNYQQSPGSVRNYLFEPDHENSLSSNFVNVLHIDAEGNLWIGSQGNSSAQAGALKFFLDRLNPEAGVIEKMQVFQDQSQILNIQNDNKGNIWWASASKLYCLDMKLKTTRSRTAKELGLFGMTGFIIDRQGYFWIADQAFGLSLFDLELRKVLSLEGLTWYDGNKLISLLGNKHSRDLIWLNSFQGFAQLNPQEVIDVLRKQTSEILISDLELLNENGSPSKDLSFGYPIGERSPQIQLPYSENSLSVLFSNLSLSDPKQNRFLFKLDPYEEQWRYSEGFPEATYLHLPPGSYTFRARANNGKGLWSEEKMLSLMIKPPWWRTTWAYLLWATISFGMAFLIYRFQLNRQLAKAEYRRLQELNLFKNRLYTNMTHEFRTPLTVILGLGEQVSKLLLPRKNTTSKAKEYLALIQRNCLSLLRLVNQMLDLSKLETGNVRFNMVQADIIPFILYLVEPYEVLARSKNIRLSTYHEPESLVMDFDAEKVQCIVSNLLSNAIKFTAEDGKVSLHLSQISQNGTSFLQIKIRDTGIGIPRDQVERIFDRFYQVDGSSTRLGEGTGIGLALTKELLVHFGGDIRVDSEVGKGSVFNACLPIKRKAIPADPKLDPGPDRFLPTMPSQSASSFTEADPGNGSLPTLLIIDDNPDVIVYIKSCLENQYRTSTARNGEIGIDKALKEI
ncbi:MAG: two-component regulator propeller domain-containing protein, partial [Pseudomonadota bacterium]